MNDDPDKITEADLYAISQESITAFKLLEKLCKALNLPFPPKPE